MRHPVLTLLAACLISASIASPAAHAAMPEVLFILDSSGSMAESIGSERKIDAAKRVMREVTPGLPAEVLVGLVAYGHRRPGDCSDIEVLTPAGSSDRQALLAQVESLEPRGKTPITTAVLAAAGMLKSKDCVTSVVLVSDGLETCGGDPCKVVRELKATGCQFVMHTVGFDVDPAAAKQLSCLAQAGGGRHFSAPDGDALLAALKEVGAGVAEEVAQAKVRDVTRSTGLGKLRLTMPAGAEESLRYVEIARVSDGKIIKTITDLKDDSNHPLVAGDYQVTAGFAVPNHGESPRVELGEFTVAGGSVREAALGAVAFNIPTSIVKADNWRDRLHVERVGVKDSGTGAVAAVADANGNGYYNFKDKPVLPGIYDVEFTYAGADEPAVVARRVTVRPGGRSTVTLDSGIRFVRPEQAITGWRVYRRPTQQAAPDEDQGVAPPRELALQVRAAPGLANVLKVDHLFSPYLLPPGTYDIEVDVEGMTEPLPAGEGVKIDAGELLRFETGL